MNEHNPESPPTPRHSPHGGGRERPARATTVAEAGRREAAPPLSERLPRPPQVIRIGGRTIPMPASRWVRIALGSALVLFGILGFLPILGFWMVPLGLLVLSIDLAIVRRWRRRFVVWFQRRFPATATTLRRWTSPSHLRGGEDRR